ncbi:hypothetical protein D9M71_336780 [compost metagenome]
MVGDLVGPHPAGRDALQVLRLVLVELRRVHNPQPILFGPVTGLEVVENAQRSVDLPHMIRVQALQLGDRRRRQHLVRVQVVDPKCTSDGTFRQRHHLAGLRIHPRCQDFPICAQGLHRILQAEQPFLIAPRRVDQYAADQLRLVQCQRRSARIGAALARGGERHSFQLAQQRGPRHA